ncbi:MAG: sensor protein hoxX [Gammaproteobacteria bacterium]|nr:MAG: sensor protein hoxX [Gammaproteobacteria bacterium]
MKILLFASAYNGMCQRVHRELEAEQYTISIELSSNEQQMINAVENFQPDLIVCPFLKHAVPEKIWRHHLCLIVHPGIEGDRGPSSLDWAIHSKMTTWGVTLLQADAEMDAGDIWDSQKFQLRNGAKASIYRREVIATAVRMIKNAVQNSFRNSDFKPRALDYNNPQVKGTCLPLMRQDARKIDWGNETTEAIVRKINAADSFPGVLDSIAGNDVYLYGAKAEYSLHSAVPGDIVGHRDGAICRATVDGSVWIRQLKMVPKDERKFFKLSSIQVIKQQFPNAEQFSNLNVINSRVQNDIHIEIENAVAYVSFDFYNGAMNTEQCHDLLARLREIRQRNDVRVVTLLGGEDFWSNGIHLNCIQAAVDPARESWRNINAIDDVVHEIISMTNKLTVAGLRNNAGAGGAIMPLACDKVLARDGIVLNPHYLTMGLFGSEYWTYLLPKRVGETKAKDLIESCMPILAPQAQTLGMVDKVLPEDWVDYHELLRQECESLADDINYFPALARKQFSRMQDEAAKPLGSYRQHELQRMKSIFDNPLSEYHQLRYNFVYKVSCAQTPARLIYRIANEKVAQIA